MKHSKKIFFSVTTLCLMGLGLFVVKYASADKYNYVRGEYGTHCYPKDDYNKNIKYILKFSTLEECQNSLKKHGK